MNSCASSPNLRMSDWENRPTNARCPDKKNCELGIMVQSHYSNRPSLDATCRWAKTWGTHVDRTTVCIEFVGPCFSQFFFRFSFSFLFFLWGGGGGLKLRSYCRKFFRLPYQENMHFRGLRSNYTKITGPILTKFGTMVHHTTEQI